MKINLFIVTYNNALELNKTLKSLFESDLNTVNCEIFIINNHSNFSMNKKFEGKVTILHNVLRPDNSTGYLTRNWNQALILGFGNLNTPLCDIVVAVQDDTLFYPLWVRNLLQLQKKYSFITYGWGDNFMSWTPEGVKQIGLWDESFQMSGHTSDYFLRALIFNREKSSINDYYHKRVLNPEVCKIATRPNTLKTHRDDIKKNSPYGIRKIQYKWGKVVGCSDMLTHWKNMLFKISNEIRPKNATPILYPFFEDKILTLKEQKYV